jgi:hypothetical protein
MSSNITDRYVYPHHQHSSRGCARKRQSRLGRACFATCRSWSTRCRYSRRSVTTEKRVRIVLCSSCWQNQKRARLYSRSRSIHRDPRDTFTSGSKLVAGKCSMDDPTWNIFIVPNGKLPAGRAMNPSTHCCVSNHCFDRSELRYFLNSLRRVSFSLN